VTESSRSVAAAVLALCGCLVIAGVLLLVQRPAEPEQPAGPDFALRSMQGDTVQLSSLRGHVVLIDFWATWCGPCREELPMLVHLAQRLEPKGVRLVAISEDDPPAQEPDVIAFAKEVPGLEHFAVYGNPDVESLFGVDSLPTLFVLDREGRLLTKLVGGRSEAELAATVEAALR
jgi:thiol-disulfide isomerase/thioredoxin